MRTYGWEKLNFAKSRESITRKINGLGASAYGHTLNFLFQPTKLELKYREMSRKVMTKLYAVKTGVDRNWIKNL